MIGDVWLASLVGWVTGRASAADMAAQMEKAVHLLLRGLTASATPRTGTPRYLPRPASSRRPAAAAARGCGAR